jgi:hypothetical protein
MGFHFFLKVNPKFFRDHNKSFFHRKDWMSFLYIQYVHYLIQYIVNQKYEQYQDFIHLKQELQEQ